MAGLGDEFRAAREARHLSLAEVSDQIHIRSVYLQSIEAEDWSALAAPVYARGFIRTYARFLGLDGERAVAEFGNVRGETPHKPLEPGFLRSSRPRRSPWLWLATAVAALLVGFVAFNAMRLQQGRPAPPAQAARAAQTAASGSSLPAASSAGAASPVAASVGPSRAGRTLEVRVITKSWLAVSVDGRRELVGIFPAGTRRAFHGATASVRTGNGAGVDLIVNGKKLGPMGASGAVVERRLSLVEE